MGNISWPKFVAKWLENEPKSDRTLLPAEEKAGVLRQVYDGKLTLKEGKNILNFMYLLMREPNGTANREQNEVR